ncbi:RNA polymerase recycling motor HelD [Gracilibacillus salinarum]|uniref:AAA family ATPase n=1 Tax=Gracilibacillus salinarum TaxID=2932255 RepID=A0ABY4GS89_9BACI|nr:RNA polymerase recycling motor HelD [Gracilibacillus salinarum]UOQ87268.1 AAA family ATPase [Gracilibacillus salinarum]
MSEEWNDQEWQEEKQRVDDVVHEIKKKITSLQSKAKDLKEDVIDIRRDFWEDVTVNIEEMDDKIETEASIKQQAEFLSERERSHGQVSEKLDILRRLEDKPYFGRIDFKEENGSEELPIYIGLASVLDEDEDNFLVYDWRAPISSMYYDYPPGPASYDTVQGNISGEITLKRQYMIQFGELKGMFDTGLTIGDHLLQSVLGNQASTKMKSIVSTIQREQNQIIRNERAKVLIVQGVAGSGKTSAALQRVAYLLYRYRETLTSEQIVLFSPNPLFNSYVATVLPELGEDNMQQMTFYQYLHRQLDDSFQLETPFEQMEYYLNKQGNDYEARVESMHYKASLDYKALIDHYLEHLSTRGIVFRNITFRGQVIIPKQMIEKYFYQTEGRLPIADRLEKVSNWILLQLKRLEKVEREKDWVLEESELLEKADYVDVHHMLQEENQFSEDTFDDYDREEELLRKKVVAWRLRPLRKKVKQLAFVDPLRTFRQLFSSDQWITDGSLILPEQWKEICYTTEEHLKQKYLTWEDAPAFIYFEKNLLGFDAQRTIQHLFIDEAQDYTPFQFVLMKQMFPVSSMTLLGDINQAIYAHALRDETLLSEKWQERHERIVLTRSYRSTAPIVEFTKSFMPNGDLIEPFEREGDTPIVMEVEQHDMLDQKIVEQIELYEQNGHETIALIGKTLEECQTVYDRLKHRVTVELMTQEAHIFNKGIVVIPAYLAKGIEFDAVIILDASDHNFQDELERNLFYTACTRAMHDLALFSIGKPTHFLQDIPKQQYRHYKVHQISQK